MASLEKWLSCPECGDASSLHITSWSYGFQAECERCQEILFYEL